MLTHVHLLVHTLWCSALFEKIKCIFSIAPVGNLEKSRERTLATEAPDAASERPVQTVPGPARVRHRTKGTGCRPVRPVVSVRCAGVLRPSLRMGPVSTGSLASGDPQVCGTLCV